MLAPALQAVVGVWLMAAPAVLGYEDHAAANANRIIGPMLAALGFIAMWEVLRGLRLAALAIAPWMLLSPWVLAYPADATLNNLAVGTILLALAPFGGKTQKPYGGGWSSLWPTERVVRTRR